MPAGWVPVRGTLRLAVAAMQARFGSTPADILAGIGPSIAQIIMRSDPMNRGQGAQALGRALRAC